MLNQEALSIEVYELDENGDTIQKKLNNDYFPKSEKRAQIIGRDKNKADFVIEGSKAVSLQQVMLRFIDNQADQNQAEEVKQVKGLQVQVSHIGMGSTYYSTEEKDNKVQVSVEVRDYVKMTGVNKVKVFNIEEKAVKLYFGAKREVYVLIRKAVAENINYHNQDQNMEIYFEEHVCDCRLNFKSVKCFICKKLFICETCFIFMRKDMLIKNKIEQVDTYSIFCKGNHPLTEQILREKYQVSQGKVILKFQ